MTDRLRAILTVLVALAATSAAVAPVVAVAPAPSGGTDTADTGSLTGVHPTGDGAVTDPTGADPAAGSDDARREPAPIGPNLRSAEGTVDVVVRLGEANVAGTTGRERAVSRLKQHAERSQQAVVGFAERRDGVDVRQQFWLTNAVLLRVNTDKIRLEEVARIEGVQRLHDNHEYSIPDPGRKEGGSTDRSTRGATTSTATTASGSYNTTYGLAQVNATKVWTQYDTKGDGVKVAVLDTGVNVSHPDIDLYTENASDPTYPGGWAEFNDSGAKIEGSTPYDSDTHGTHTSGTVSGGDASGEYIGVAPNVSLMHGLVLPSGGGSWAQIQAGIEWAVANGADVVSMSLGADGYYGDLIDAVRNAQAAGTIVVVSSGNSGEGSSGSPGNYYESFAVGASDSNADITSFSSGELIDTDSDWGSTAPDAWPAEYVVPDVAAPGNNVKSAVPSGGYAKKDGTSMAAPHVAGAVALLESAADENLSVAEIKRAFRGTAWKPPGEPSGNDTRYGAGIIDVYNATRFVESDAGVSGYVEDANGNSIEGASVSVGEQFGATTDSTGYYEAKTVNGTYDVTADAFGYEAATKTVTVDGSYARTDFQLSPQLEVKTVRDQPEIVESGRSMTVEFDAANVDSLTVSQTGSLDTSDATLAVNGDRVAFGETVSFDDYTGTITVTVEPAEGTNGTVELSHAFTGPGGDVTRATGPTTVEPSVVRVAVLDTESGSYGDDTAVAVRDHTPDSYRVTLTTPDRILGNLDAYEAVVVQKFPTNDTFVSEFRRRTSGDETGVVYLDQWASYSNAITQLSAATGDPSSVGTGYGDTSEKLVITANHTIFDGVGSAGDEIPIHDGGYGDIAWYTDFHGTDIADVSNGTAIKGRGVGVDAANRTVLLAPLGRQAYATNPDFRAGANRTFGNAVVYAANASATDRPPLTRLWNYTAAAGSQYTSPAVGPKYVFVGGLDDTVAALNRTTGAVAWTFDRAGSLSDSSPVYRQTTVYVGGGGGYVYALDAVTGGVVWKHGTDSAVVSSPTLQGDSLYVGSNDGTVLALNASTGADLWTTELDAAVMSKPAVTGDYVYVTTDDGRVVALHGPTGSILWSFDTGTELGHAGVSVSDGTVYVGAEEVYALDGGDGSVLWNASYGGTSGSTPVVADGTVYVGAADGALYALSATDGTTEWTHATGGALEATPAVVGDRVVVPSTDGRVYLLNATTGTETANASLPGPTRSSPAIAGDDAVLGSENGTVVALANADDANGSVGNITTLATTTGDEPATTNETSDDGSTDRESTSGGPADDGSTDRESTSGGPADDGSTSEDGRRTTTPPDSSSEEAAVDENSATGDETAKEEGMAASDDADDAAAQTTPGATTADEVDALTREPLAVSMTSLTLPGRLAAAPS